MRYLARSAARDSGARYWLGGVVLACALIVVGVRAADVRAALNWNPAPLVVDPGKPLTGVSCPTAALCVASSGAQELAFDPNRFARPRSRALFTGRGLVVDGLWCPAAAGCVAISFQRPVSFDPIRFRRAPGRAIEPEAGEGLVALRCPSRTECVTVDSFGDAVTFNPQTQKIIRRQIKVDSDEAQTALACPSVRECTSLDNDGYEQTFQPQTGQRLGGFQIDPAVGLDAPSGASDNELDGISCQSTRLCTAVDTLGNLITFDPLLGAGAGPFAMTTVTADPGSSLAAISCKPSGVCVAVDRSGNAIGGSTATQSWQLQTVDPGHAFNSVACPTSTECIAVDSAGDAFRLHPSSL